MKEVKICLNLEVVIRYRQTEEKQNKNMKTDRCFMVSGTIEKVQPEMGFRNASAQDKTLP